MESLKSPERALPYDPQTLPRELKRHYVSASDADIAAMLAELGMTRVPELYREIPEAVRFESAPELPEELSYQALQARMAALAEKNQILSSFLGDALPAYKVPAIVAEVADIRNLTTAYTPYQPERSQGTLMTHWIYQCVISQLTGFEAINSSLYDRATAIFEAACAAVRLSRKANKVLISEALFPGDLEVLHTLAEETEVEFVSVGLAPITGRIDPEQFARVVESLGNELAAIIFPQVNCLGLLEDVDALTDLAHRAGVRAIAVIDPILLATGGLKPPSEFGEQGADMIVGEAQHLAIGPNFGGPGLGLFGVRHNAKVRNDIRQTPGRYVGKAKDFAGRDCLVMVLSTREQHIRKEKATSNICSNQAFLATLAGAAVLSRGEQGMQAAVTTARKKALEAAQKLSEIPAVQLAFPGAHFFNEIVVDLPEPIAQAIQAGRDYGLHIGVDVSERVPGGRNLLKISFSDLDCDIEALANFFRSRNYAGDIAPAEIPAIPETLLRAAPVGLPDFSEDEITAYYRKLGELNVSPDDGCYPLGSCTMKYNPYINDWAANLEGFTDIHPQAPAEDAQGCLELLFEIQEWFKKITGLAGVTTQPVAGAQGELVGLKMFQAYHRDRGEAQRDVILIPSSAHGTNFATAAMAGYREGTTAGQKSGIVLLKPGSDGLVDMADFEAKLAEFGPRIAGIMITNPNTCGLFETRFQEIAEKVHQAGGLVYMDGANMNAIAGWLDLGTMGVDAVHNNLHKTWTIPHGGGGPGDAIVAVSERLLPYLPGHQIEKTTEGFRPVCPQRSIGSFHRHWGNFAHKVRAYTYLLRLGKEGVPRMTALATLSARYCFEKLRQVYPSLPAGAENAPRMHEFILTLTEAQFDAIEATGVPKALAITRIGKLFLDFGFHAPTVAWPETFGLMIEPTESYSKAELDRFCEAVAAIKQMITEHPEVLTVVPLFTPVDRIDDVTANRNLILSEPLTTLPETHPNRCAPSEIASLPIEELYQRILEEAERRIGEG